MYIFFAVAGLGSPGIVLMLLKSMIYMGCSQRDLKIA